MQALRPASPATAGAAGATGTTASLARLVREGPAAAGGAARVVAFDASSARERDGAELEARAAGIARIASQIGVGRWVLVAQDAFLFAAGLLGLWRAGCVAVLPPNGEEGTLSRLRVDAVGTWSDREDLVRAGTALDLRAAPAPAEAAAHGGAAPVTGAALDPGAPALELYTSGTAGASKPTSKTLRQLEAEIAELERALGPELAGEAAAASGAAPRPDAELVRIFGTASPQHLYGLLFRVLWPLCAGRPFAADSLLHAEELVPRLAATTSCALAGTPAHLRRLRAHPGLADLRGRVRAVFSSGGALDAETAAAFASALGRTPVEIYGSTETGGIGLRRQEPGAGAEAAWTPFAPVRVERDEATGCARVHSPYLAAGLETSGLLVEDRVTLLGDGRFRLEGRADRVVKVGEKRLSLPDMEERLLAHETVADASLLVVGRGIEPRVAAVVVPTGAGREILAGEGRRGLARLLTRHLARDFDRVLLPRAWRVVDEIPVDGRGKRSQEALAALFADGADARVVDPEIDGERREGNRLERWLRVPDDLAYVEGHFPGSPVVPGVVQLRWALAAAEALLGGPAAPSRLDAVKFKEMLRPGDAFRLVVEIEPDASGGAAFSYEVKRDDRTVSSGRGILAAPGFGDAEGAA